MNIENNRRAGALQDPSLWFLVLSNVVAILLATVQHWNLSTIMWVYWSQSVTIGIFNFIRILQLKEFSTSGLLVNGRYVDPTPTSKRFIAFFFLFHYGFFHLIYFVFLAVGFPMSAHGGAPKVLELQYILPTVLLFFLNHLYSFFYNKQREAGKLNITTLIFYPYARIFPMHLTIIFGSIVGGALPLFLVLKTFADAIMHIVEHNIFRGDDRAAAGASPNIL